MVVVPVFVPVSVSVPVFVYISISISSINQNMKLDKYSFCDGNGGAQTSRRRSDHLLARIPRPNYLH